MPAWFVRKGAVVVSAVLLSCAGVMPAWGDTWNRRELATPRSSANATTTYNILSTPVGLPSTEVFFESDGVPRVGFLGDTPTGFDTGEPFIASVIGAGRRVDALVPAGQVGRASFGVDSAGELVYGLDLDALSIGTRDGGGGFVANEATGTELVARTYLQIDSQGMGYAYGQSSTPDFRWTLLQEGADGIWSAESPAFLDDSPVTRSFGLVIDSSDRPVITHRDPVEGLTIRRREASGDWSVLYSTGLFNGLVPSASTSLAAGPNGEVALAYLAENQVQIALIDGAGNVTEEVVSSDGETYRSYLDVESLAFDANGNLALALTSELGDVNFFFGETANDVLLARRTGPGQWDIEDTGLDNAYQASVGFDDQNNPYLAVVEYDAISLISPNILPSLAADANLDGVVDLLDFDALARHFGEATFAGRAEADFNDDGVVDLLDFDILAQGYGQGASPAAAPQPAPEPAALAIFALAGPLAAGRRR